MQIYLQIPSITHMELAPRYCRSCGSRILVKNVCHNCNNDPLKGDNYCYDCGALTPNADSCLRCGAKYKTSFPLKPVLLIGGLVIVLAAAAGYFLSRPNTPTASEQPKNIVETPKNTAPPGQETDSTGNTVVNKPTVVTTDTSIIINNKPAADTTVAKPPVADTSKNLSPNVFVPEELHLYKGRCSYFAKNQRSQVYFFTLGGSGYIKMNGKIYELKRKRKGVDVAVFSNNDYEVTIRIDGLSGSAKEWLASCTLSIKAIISNASMRHKVYSTCIEL